jgi:hypothetical protein
MANDPQTTTYRIIRASACYGLVIAVEPADATPDSETASYHRCADWQIAQETPDQFHPITRMGALGYFSGHADGLGFGTVPDQSFATLDEVLAYRNTQRSKSRSDTMGPADKHPDHVEGWGGSLEALVAAIGKMRYDRVAAFMALFDKELQRQAAADRRAHRVKLATRLDRAATHLGIAKNELDHAWKISAPHMGSVTNGE